MMEIADLPAVNATLNAIALFFLLLGYAMIRRGRVDLHRASMLAALGASALFLISYSVYHANAGSRPFTGRGLMRLTYFSILITHIILAIAIVPLAIVTVTRALRAQFDRHVAIARWTWPVWIYVSVTGILVYLMLYRLG